MSEQETGNELALNDEILRQYTAGYDNQAATIAMLPERVEFDKKLGCWKSESWGDGVVEVKGTIVSAITVWAVWSDKVGSPVCLDIGAPCQERGGHEMGLRLIWADEFGDLYYWDAFGVCFKSAQGAVRRARRRGAFCFDGFKEVNTKYGSFRVPKLEALDEGGQDGTQGE